MIDKHQLRMTIIFVIAPGIISILATSIMQLAFSMSDMQSFLFASMAYVAFVILFFIFGSETIKDFLALGGQTKHRQPTITVMEPDPVVRVLSLLWGLVRIEWPVMTETVYAM